MVLKFLYKNSFLGKGGGLETIVCLCVGLKFVLKDFNITSFSIKLHHIRQPGQFGVPRRLPNIGLYIAYINPPRVCLNKTILVLLCCSTSFSLSLFFPPYHVILQGRLILVYIY